ncbi:MAG: hypothetical protein JSW67_14750 [Candidatus Latescibacterota bacterium]|nr:MAG: hypothetical protein JSW67_14750 [Candidatus Latescibacterota bacterium]
MRTDPLLVDLPEEPGRSLGGVWWIHALLALAAPLGMSTRALALGSLLHALGGAAGNRSRWKSHVALALHGALASVAETPIEPGGRMPGITLVTLLSSLLLMPASTLPTSTEDESSPEITAAAPDADASGWWDERKKRFRELALCALAGANLSIALALGAAGAAAVPGPLASVVLVLVRM